MQDCQALFEDWKAKHEAIGNLVTKYSGHSWAEHGDFPRTTVEPASPVTKDIVRAFTEARELERLAWQALVECIEAQRP